MTKKKAKPGPKEIKKTAAPAPAPAPEQPATPPPAPATTQPAVEAEMTERVRERIRYWWNSPVAKPLIGDMAHKPEIAMSVITALTDSVPLSAFLAPVALESLLSYLSVHFAAGNVVLGADPTFGDLVAAVDKLLKETGR